MFKLKKTLRHNVDDSISWLPTHEDDEEKQQDRRIIAVFIILLVIFMGLLAYIFLIK